MSAQPEPKAPAAPTQGCAPSSATRTIPSSAARSKIDQLLDKLADNQFLAVLGTSGSGKSSLVRAGLLPALDSGFMGAAGARWTIAELRPGDQPFRRLAAALVEHTEWGRVYAAQGHGEGAAPTDGAIEELEQHLRSGSMALNWRLGVQPLPEGTRLLILVDQFEELFRYQRSNRREAADFVALLLAAATHPDVYLVITLRSEFLGDCSAYPGLPEAINRGLFLTPALTPEQMADAIQLPVELPEFRGLVEPDLVRRLLEEARGQTDQLPLLQHALMRLWDLDDGDRRLTLTELEALGGLRQALNSHVEEAFAELDQAQQRIAEVLFRGLTERGSAERDTRRPVRLGEIADMAGVDWTQVAAVVEVFRKPGRCFLMPPAGTDLTPDRTLDISHEALIRQWRSLAGWTANEAEQAELYQRLESAARRNEKHKGALWIDPDLQIALNWRDEHKPTKPWARRYGGDFDLAMRFLDKSRDAREAQRDAEEQRQKKEIRRAWIIAVASVIALLVTAAFAGWALYERGHAEAQTALAQKNAEQARLNAGLAEAGRKRAEAAEKARTESLFDSGLTHAALLARGEDYAEAREVLRKTAELDKDIPEHRRHTRNLLAGYVDILGGSADKVYEGAGAALSGGVAVSPDGRWLAAAGERGTLVLFDAESGKLVRRLEGHDAQASRWGRLVGCLRPRGRSSTVEATTGASSAGPCRTGRSSPNGRRRTGSMPLPSARTASSWPAAVPDGSIILWSTETGKRLRTLKGHTHAIAAPNGLAFSPDGKRLASASLDKTARIWDVKTGKTLHTLQWHDDSVEGVAFSPDGKAGCNRERDKRIVLWDAETGRTLYACSPATTTSSSALAFDADGHRLLSASLDNTMRLWDVATGVTLRVYQGHTAGLWAVARHGDTLYTASNDQTVRRWSLDTPGQWVWDLPVEPTSAAIAPDVSFVAVGFADGALRAYPLPNPRGGALCRPTPLQRRRGAVAASAADSRSPKSRMPIAPE